MLSVSLTPKVSLTISDGDDSVYPDTIAPPVDKAVYAKRLAFVKSLGFHFVRCHSVRARQLNCSLLSLLFF